MDDPALGVKILGYCLGTLLQASVHLYDSIDNSMAYIKADKKKIHLIKKEAKKND